jgi:hypothetical protein
MPFVPDAVPEEALDYAEILRRGGANCGDEDFALCKCPRCARVYLLECEVDTLFPDPGDLTQRVPLSSVEAPFRCEGCGQVPEWCLGRPARPGGDAGDLAGPGGERLGVGGVALG